MDSAIWISILKGIGLFFIHPLLYLGVFIMLFIGINRVKRERKDFHVRVYDFIEELFTSWRPGILMGIILSLIIVGLGLVLTPSMLVFITVAYFILALTVQIRWLSPAFVFPLTLIFLFFLGDRGLRIPIVGELYGIEGTQLFHLAILFALLIMAEGVLIRWTGHSKTSPRLFESTRGKHIGGHESRRFWPIPLFILVPEGAIPVFMQWPLLSVGTETSFSIVLIPFFIGFLQLVKSTIPVPPIKLMGSRVMAIGFILALFIVGGYFYPFLMVIGAFLVLILREGLWAFNRIQDEAKVSYFSPREHGIVILGVLPGSPAKKMGLKIGELIMKVNGVSVNKPSEFYEALQKNSAYCKLEIMDFQGEVRFAQAALYDGEHHQIGVLFVKEDYKLQDSIV